MHNLSLITAYLQVRPFKPTFVPVSTDEHGLVPESLAKKIEEISSSNKNKKNTKMPKMLYVQPNCSNPIGVSMTLERRQRLFEVNNSVIQALDSFTHSTN